MQNDKVKQSHWNENQTESQQNKNQTLNQCGLTSIRSNASICSFILYFSSSKTIFQPLQMAIIAKKHSKIHISVLAK